MATRYPSRESQDSDWDDSRDPSKASPIVELSSPHPDRTSTTPPMRLVRSAKHGTDKASPNLPRDAGRRTFPSILIDRGTTRYSLLTDDDPPEDDINRTIRGLHIIEGAGRNNSSNNNKEYKYRYGFKVDLFYHLTTISRMSPTAQEILDGSLKRS